MLSLILLRACAQDFNFSEVDPSSFSNLDELRTKSYELNLTLDFDRRVILSAVRYNFSILAKTDTLLLDVAGLKVKSVRLIDEINRKETNLTFSQTYPKAYSELGGYLNITLPKNHSAIFKHVGIAIDCQTTDTYPLVRSVSWLSPEQTADKAQPYLFTQNQAIYARSIFPCQDSPSVKSTYLAEVYTPPGIRAFLSGERTFFWQTAKFNLQRFNQSIPIPSYLFAIVAGAIDKVYISDRIAVITEQSQMVSSLHQLEDADIFLNTIEQYTNMEYPWSEYAIVILPPSFPLGGMENPFVTFASPSIIVGDKSNINVAIHEMAHSWTGNTVTCRNWNSFWLNEGYTVFIENRVNKQLYGEQFFNISMYVQQRQLNDSIAGFGPGNNYTSLNPRIKHENPDDAYSVVPYFKGSEFLTYVERLVGAKVMQQFTDVYLLRYIEQSITTNDLFIYMRYFFTLKNKELEFRKIDWEKWINGTGYSAVHLDFKSAALDSTLQLVENYRSNDPKFDIKFPEFIASSTVTSTLLKQVFFKGIDDGSVNPDKARNLDSKFKITVSQINLEVLTPWFQYLLKNQVTQAIPAIDEKVLSKIGRMKFIRPLYNLINKLNHQQAVSLFNKNKVFYHPIAITQISRDLGL